jgi:hypothetical protein
LFPGEKAKRDPSRKMRAQDDGEEHWAALKAAALRLSLSLHQPGARMMANWVPL